MLAALLPLVEGAGQLSHTGVAQRLAEGVDAAVAVLGVDSIGLMLLDDRDALQAVGFSDRPAAQLETAQARAVRGPGVDATRRREVVAVADLAAAPEYASLWEELGPDGIRAVLAVPLSAGGEVVGNLNAARRSVHEWTPAEMAAAEACAKVVGVILELVARASASTDALHRLQSPWGTSPEGDHSVAREEGLG
jgi:GAF domain-containing protein